MVSVWFWDGLEVVGWFRDGLGVVGRWGGVVGDGLGLVWAGLEECRGFRKGEARKGGGE